MIKDKLNTLLKEQLTYPKIKTKGQRAIADMIEDECNRLITANFTDTTPAKSVKTIEDINIGNIYIDHKTSDRARKFKMPNLISIARLKKLDRPLIYNFVIYDSDSKTIVDNFTLNVYELNWDYLKIRNLGKGQMQITSMKNFLTNPITTLTKEQWLSKLKEEAIAFYKQVQKDAAKRQKEWEET